MDQKVSVFVPVHNVADQLASRVEGLLDVMSETLAAFDVWIIDDGSTDDTTQIGHDLALYYPQVTLLRHATRLGTDAAIQTGLNQSCGDTILVHTATRPPAAREIFELLEMRADVELVLLCDEASPSGSSPTWVDRLMGWGSQVAVMRGGNRSLEQDGHPMRMIRRDGSRPVRMVKMGPTHETTEYRPIASVRSSGSYQPVNSPSR